MTQNEYRKFIGLAFLFASKKRYQPFTTKIKSFTWHVADNLSFIWQYYEIFTEESYNFKTNNPQPVIYDCGSNIGLSCLFFALKFPHAKIKAFEPDKSIFQLLKKNIAQLPNSENIQLFEKAVWIKNEMLNFSSDGADSGTILHQNNTQTLQVEALDLLSFLKNETKIDLLKIDIEGAETQLIPHLKTELNKVENIFIEYHSFRHSPQNLGEILSLLSAANFRYYLTTQNMRKSPMLNLGKNPVMDYQTNIYGYKNQS